VRRITTARGKHAKRDLALRDKGWLKGESKIIMSFRKENLKARVSYGKNLREYEDGRHNQEKSCITTIRRKETEF